MPEHPLQRTVLRVRAADKTLPLSEIRVIFLVFGGGLYGGFGMRNYFRHFPRRRRRRAMAHVLNTPHHAPLLRGGFSGSIRRFRSLDDFSSPQNICGTRRLQDSLVRRGARAAAARAWDRKLGKFSNTVKNSSS